MMKQFQRMMVCLSCTEADASLLRYAMVPAHLETMKQVHFLHVSSNSTESEKKEIGGSISDEHLKAEVAAHFGEIPSNTNVQYEVLHGPLLDGTLKYAADLEIDLIMVGHRLSQPRRSAFGRRLAMKAPSSVWLVPDDTPPTIKRILVPHDFSECAAESFPVATSLARILGDAQCFALYVYFNESAEERDQYAHFVWGHENQVMADFLKSVETHGVDVKPLLAEGMDVASVITRAGELRKADLIIMSTRGLSRSAAILLGSVTEQVIIESSLPLLVVKPHQQRIGLLQSLLGWNQQ